MEKKHLRKLSVDAGKLEGGLNIQNELVEHLMLNLTTVPMEIASWKRVKTATGAQKWAAAARKADLEAALVAAKDAYYNRDPIISDEVFDIMEDVLRSRYPKSKVLQLVGSSPTTGKVRLPEHMGSLSKIKTADQVAAFATDNEGPYVVSDKLDGISILLITVGSPKLYTRGDGTNGQDISHLLPYIKSLPSPLPKNVRQRGELIMSEAKFQAWNAEFRNARNLVSGVANRKGIHKAARDVDAVFYETIGARSLSKGLAKMKQQGFKVVTHKVLNKLSYDVLLRALTIRKSKSRYAIDGIVVSTDRIAQRNTSGNPDYAMAFKPTGVGNATAQVKVAQVHWRESRHGRLTPRVEFEPVDLGGVTVTYATAHNAEYIDQNRIGPGAIIEVIRSGDVIPYITKVVKRARRAQMPDVDYTWNGPFIEIVDISDETTIRAFEYFFRNMGIENIGYGVASKLVNYGYDIPSTVHATRQELEEVLGRNGVKIHNNIRTIMGAPSIDSLMAASGVFGNGFGNTLSYTVATEIPDFMTLNKRDLTAAASEISNFGASRVTQLIAGMPAFKKFLRKLKVNPIYPEPFEPDSNDLEGEVVVFTGVRDKQLQAHIEANGGTVGSSVNRKTTALVAARTDTTKAQAARDLGITVYTLEQYKKHLGLA